MVVVPAPLVRGASLLPGSDLRASSHEERYSCQYQKYKKKDLRNSNGGTRDTTKAQYGGDDGDDKKSDGPTQHDALPASSRHAALIEF